LDRPTIIITGASHGIGAAAAVLAAEKGWQVVLSARNRDALEQLAGQVSQRGGSACIVVGDISDYRVCQTIVRQAVQSFGRIDAVINNAGIIGPLSLVADLPPEEWKRTLEVDLLGPVWMCREAVPHLRQTNGRVINISSGAAVHPSPVASAYCAAKAALLHFSKSLSMEEPALTVISFYPGEVDTSMQAEIRARGRVHPFEGIHDFFMEQYEQKRLLTPEQAARAAVTLALAAPHEWTGEFLQYGEERIQNLIRAYGGDEDYS
jgi:NAD(P)-dependent dehydrogenase (short-subunit alcohol dehydrogenase family)